MPGDTVQEAVTVQEALVGQLDSDQEEGFASVQNVLAVSAEDSVVVETSAGTRRLVWVKKSPPQRFWFSRDLYHALPTVQLADLNRDGAMDLFWSMHFEELIGGMIVAGGANGPREVQMPAQSCRAPELRRNGEAFLVLLHTPGVFAADACGQMDAALDVCGRHIESEWPRFYDLDGVKLTEVTMGPEFYGRLAITYLEGAAHLEKLIRGEDDRGMYTQLCQGLPDKLRVLADSADAVAAAR